MRDNQFVSLALRTPLCRELGIEHPIFSVGFGISAGPELVLAVSDAGGCGVLGGSGLPAEEIRRRIARVRELTDRPFGVNFIIADFEDPDSSDEDRAFVREQIDAAVDARAPLIVLFWGPPAPFVEDAHRRPRRRGSTRCTSNASWTTAPLTPSTAGCSTSGGPTRRTECCGRTGRSRSGTPRAGRLPGKRPGEGAPIGTNRRPWGEYQWPRYAPGMVTPDFDGDPEYAPMWAGESCGVVKDVKPAGVIVRDLVREAEATLAEAEQLA